MLNDLFKKQPFFPLTFIILEMKIVQGKLKEKLAFDQKHGFFFTLFLSYMTAAQHDLSRYIRKENWIYVMDIARDSYLK